MAKKGRAGPALCIAAIGSFIAGTLSCRFPHVHRPAHGAFRFESLGRQRVFALMVFGLSTVSSLAGSSLIKGAVATILGLSASLPSGSTCHRINRYIFGIDKLMEGFDIIVACDRPFLQSSEIFMTLEEMAAGTLEQFKGLLGSGFPCRDFLDSLGAIIRGPTFWDSSVGAIPASGHVTAVPFPPLLPWKRNSAEPENFGRGNPGCGRSGIGHNNAAACGACLPSFDVRLPASTSRRFSTALLMVGVKPSRSCSKKSRIIWGLGWPVCTVATSCVLILKPPLGRPFCPDPFDSRPAGFCRSVLGEALPSAFIMSHNSALDLILATFTGHGRLLDAKKFDFPLCARSILGLVFGDLMEQSVPAGLDDFAGAVDSLPEPRMPRLGLSWLYWS